MEEKLHSVRVSSNYPDFCTGRNKNFRESIFFGILYRFFKLMNIRDLVDSYIMSGKYLVNLQTVMIPEV